MKVGLPASIALHSALIAWAIVSLPGREQSVPVVDAMPVEFVPIGEATQLRLGQKTARPKEEIVAKDAAKAAKESDGQRAGTSKHEEPPPAPPEAKPQQVAALPKEEPKPAPPRPPEPKPVAKAEPPKEEPKPERPKEAEKAKETGEGKPPEAKDPPKDQKALDKLIDKAEKEPPKKEPEKKPEPPKAPEKKAEPARTASAQPAQPSPAKSQFDAKNISDILNRNQTASSAAPETRTASLGSPTGRNAAIKMTQNEMDALMGQIQKCWNPPIGAAEAGLKVVLRFNLAQDGSLVGRPAPVEAPAHPLGLSLARSAERAIMQCGPYKLPAEQYAAWSDVIATFDPNNL